ncbi:MAG: CsgG/HfaB family protein [Chitinispirillales bacterium]|nr:CsgG/HfaB family protein [Chitinispirillales bacterium]
MKKLVTYVIMMAYLTVTLQPVHAQQQFYGDGQAVAPAQSGGRPQIAIYVSEHSGYSNEEKAALRSATLNTIVRSGRYQVVERSNVIEAELLRQASGAIDDDQLTTFGRQSGAQYVCVADMTFLRDRREKHTRVRTRSNGTRFEETYHTNHRDYQVSVRLIDVETAEVLAFGLVERDIQNAVAMTNAITEAVDRMLATVQAPQAPGMPKMAVYVTGGRSGHSGQQRRQSGQPRQPRRQRQDDALYSYTLHALFDRSRNLGNFKVIERAEAFTLQIDREQVTQRSGHVDDGQIARLGRQYGIERILVVAMEYAQNQYVISGRIINVETASVEQASQIFHADQNLRGLGGIATRIVVEMKGLTAAEQQEIATWQAERQAAEAKAAKMAVIGGVIAAAGAVGLLILLISTSKKNNENVSVR